MGLPVLIFGPSGSGKSRSLKNFGAKEIFVNNVEAKELPFKNEFEYIRDSDDVNTILKYLQEMPCKTAVIDDAGYIMTHYFMKNHRDKSGNKSFEMYDEIADRMYTLIQGIKRNLPRDTIVYIIMHEDKNDYGDIKLKTIGKLLDNKVCMEGMVTICLRCMSEGGRHFFRTQTMGNDVAKSPEGMFDAVEIDNDLKMVDTKIREFYGWEESN